MKLPRLIRPQFDIEYVRYRDFPRIASIILRRAVFVRILNIQIHGVTVQKHRIWIVPKYKVKKVNRIEEQCESE